ncbi:hypothetical protein [Calothrix sp. NIES-2100]
MHISSLQSITQDSRGIKILMLIWCDRSIVSHLQNFATIKLFAV